MIFKGARLLMQLSDIKFLFTSKAIPTRQIASHHLPSYLSRLDGYSKKRCLGEEKYLQIK